MKLLLVSTGSPVSTADVWAGLMTAFQRAGVDLVHYNLEGRLDAAVQWLDMCWERNGKTSPKPKEADAIYFASTMMIERALRFMPDWVFYVTANYVHPDVFMLLKRAGLKVAILFTESPNDDQWQIPIAGTVDACWTNERSSLAKFREVQPRTYYYQHACDPTVHHLAGPDPHAPTHDAVFVGTGWEERIQLFEAVDWTGIDVGLYGFWDWVDEASPLKAHVAGGMMENGLTAKLYRNAKIGLNMHRLTIGVGLGAPRIDYAESINPRCYELAACGLFYLTDWRAELDDVFGGVVPTFGSPEELGDKIRYYLAHDVERRQIAERLPGLVAGHTFDARVKDILQELEA